MAWLGRVRTKGDEAELPPTNFPCMNKNGAHGRRETLARYRSACASVYRSRRSLSTSEHQVSPSFGCNKVGCGDNRLQLPHPSLYWRYSPIPSRSTAIHPVQQTVAGRCWHLRTAIFRLLEARLPSRHPPVPAASSMRPSFCPG
jgi:hypothetical protein